MELMSELPQLYRRMEGQINNLAIKNRLSAAIFYIKYRDLFQKQKKLSLEGESN